MTRAVFDYVVTMAGDLITLDVRRRESLELLSAGKKLGLK
jgi:hypothetical protein